MILLLMKWNFASIQKDKSLHRKSKLMNKSVKSI